MSESTLLCHIPINPSNSQMFIISVLRTTCNSAVFYQFEEVFPRWCSNQCTAEVSSTDWRMTVPKRWVCSFSVPAGVMLWCWPFLEETEDSSEFYFSVTLFIGSDSGSLYPFLKKCLTKDKWILIWERFIVCFVIINNIKNTTEICAVFFWNVPINNYLCILVN